VAKRTTGLGTISFNKVDPYGRGSSIVEGEGLHYLQLETIRPDPIQPRRLLPTELSNQLAAGTISPEDVLRQWVRQAEEIAASATIKHDVHELRRLAASIAQNGLINPITVRANGDGAVNADYLIVTGERRYWAHVLLVVEGTQIHEGDETRSAEKIKALFVAEGVSIRAHQMIENLMREDINAIEKAHGLWALRFELSGVTYRSPSANGTYKKESGEVLATWTQVEKEMGISKLRGLPNLQVAVLQQLIAWQKENEAEDRPGRPIVASVQALVEKLLARTERTQNATSVVQQATPTVAAQQFQKRMQTALRYLHTLEQDERLVITDVLAQAENYDETIADLQSLRDKIEDVITDLVESRVGG